MQTVPSRAHLPISKLCGKKQNDTMVKPAISESSSGPVRSGPSADTSRKRIRVAPSTARMRFDNLDGAHRFDKAAKKTCSPSPSNPENLVTKSPSENLVTKAGNENLVTFRCPSICSTTPPASCEVQHRKNTGRGHNIGHMTNQLSSGHCRRHTAGTDVHMHAAARVQTVKSAAEHASAPQRKRRNIDNAPNKTAVVTAHSRTQQRGQVRTRGVEVGMADPAMAAAHAVDSALEHATEPPRKRQHAQPRPLTAESV